MNANRRVHPDVVGYTARQTHRTMLDESKLKRRVALKLLGSPLTLLPAMLGMTALTATWAMNWNIGIGLFAGLTGALLAAGGFLTRLVLNGDRVAGQVAEELTREEQLAQERALDDLDRLLTSADSDPRPETSLRDMRTLLKTFEQSGAGSNPLNARSWFDIQSMARRLFDQCVHSLRQTAELWQTAQRLSTPAARAPILEQRETLIADVQASIKQLSDTLVALQTLGAGEHSTGELNRIRDELDQSLAVAKKVEERMSSFIRDADVGAEKLPAGLKQKEKGQAL